MARSSDKVTIKKYANRRLYDTESSAYITLDRLAEMVREGRLEIRQDEAFAPIYVRLGENPMTEGEIAELEARNG